MKDIIWNNPKDKTPEEGQYIKVRIVGEWDQGFYLDEDIKEWTDGNIMDRITQC